MKRIKKQVCALVLATLSLLVFGDNESSGRTIGNEKITAGVLLGPCGSSTAQGPTGIDDDFTNLSIDGGFAVTPDGFTASPGTIVFKNTVENTGPGDDAFIIAVPSIPSGFRVEISTDFGHNYVTLDPLSHHVTLPVAYRASATFLLRVTAPAGLRALTGYDTIIRARSTIDPAVTNETIDRLYTGFVRLDLRLTLIGAAGAEVANAGPGTEIEFAITYTNVSSAQGAGSSLLTAYNIVINQDGNAAPNNWGRTTEHIVGASDNQGGQIVGDREGSTTLTDIVTALEPGQSGVFKFKRRIK